MANYKLVNSDQLDTDMKTVADKIREKAEMSKSLSWPSGFVDGIDQCSSLNFSVVSGTTQPSDPKDNTIWVMTEKIGAWYFSATQPENMQEWDVWFPVGTSSIVEFNALNKNGIQVYPLSAKQYVSGARVDVTAMSYRGGEWVEWIEYLFKSGKGSLYPTSEYSDQRASITIGDDKISFSALSAGSEGWIGNVLNIGPFDATNKKTLYVDLEYLTAETGYPAWQAAIGVSTTEWTDFDAHLTTNCVKFDASTFARKTVTLSIESFSGNLYFVWNGAGVANIYNIWVV